MTSADKWFRPVTSDDCKESDFHRGTPRKGIRRDGGPSSRGIFGLTQHVNHEIRPNLFSADDQLSYRGKQLLCLLL